MTRTIKASEVKPGMEIEFSLPRRMKIYKNTKWYGTSRELTDESGSFVFVGADTPVTVLAEAQPEEPTWFGARVVVNGRRFLRAPVAKLDSTPWLSQSDYIWRDWDYLCEMGPVKVIPDPGWEVPADGESTPAVPDRIEEWPEDDTALRDHKWRGRLGNTWTCAGADSRWDCRNTAGNYVGSYIRPTDDPFTRVDG